MTLPTASVIVVSRHRAAALRRCLTGLAQMDHPAFEVIVVADPAGVAAARETGLAVKAVPFDEANISAARNAGLRLAAGAVVAFIDDDAVPEPTWLSRLVAPFAAPDVVQAGGFVRGRNGISWQWRAMEVDATGRDHPLAVPAGVSLHRGTAARAVKTQGTNCAFRRDVLAAAGGFDPAYRFYLDEADVNLRLAGAGLAAIVPGAVVHHGFAASARRRGDRVPTDLHEIGASAAVFVRRHAPGADPSATLAARMAEERARALRHMVAGRMEPGAVAPLLATLAAGWADGMARDLGPLAPIAAETPFQPLPGTGPRPGAVIACRPFGRARAEAAARAAVASGAVVTLICLSPSVRRHSHVFDPAGFWRQDGGLFGQSLRTGPAFRWARFGDRIAAERRRISADRPVGDAAPH